jgi:hypothetical protein
MYIAHFFDVNGQQVLAEDRRGPALVAFDAKGPDDAVAIATANWRSGAWSYPSAVSFRLAYPGNQSAWFHRSDAV